MPRLDPPQTRMLVQTIGLTMFVFGLLVWVYVVVIQVTHPEWILGRFSHHTFPPFDWRVDDTGIIAFAVSALGFFIWRLEHTHIRRRKR